MTAFQKIAMMIGVASAFHLQVSNAVKAQQGPAVAPAQSLLTINPLLPAGVPALTLSDIQSNVHILPTPTAVHSLLQSAAPPPASGPLLYHSGGSIMPSAEIYVIFWVPPHLQNGGTTSMPAAYQNIQTRLMSDYPADGIDNNNTQYYQTIGGVTTYIGNVGGFGGSYVDTSLYPASACTDTVTPGNCITDAQIQAEIKKVMGIKGWTGGLNHIFVLYTSSGEGSCFNASSTSCAYTQYCAYHGYIGGRTPIIYANMPYGVTTYCQVAGTPSPNGNPAADTAATAASHEVTESITDPLLNAWFTSSGYEIGDLCAYNYGTNTWDAGQANQEWNGHFYELQQEYDNHKSGCVQIGP
jgi:hypothetical protein